MNRHGATLDDPDEARASAEPPAPETDGAQVGALARFHADRSLSPSAVTALQRAAGNQAVGGLMGQKTADGKPLAAVAPDSVAPDTLPPGATRVAAHRGMRRQPARQRTARCAPVLARRLPTR